MPKFFFDIVQIDGTTTIDTVVLELASNNEAHRESKRFLANMVQDAIDEDLSELRVEVRDAAGTRVALTVAHFDQEEANDSM